MSTEPQPSVLPRRGRSGLTEVGLGGAQLGNLYRSRSDEAVEAIVGRAWDLGVRYFDTAPHYGLGLSERRLGVLLRQRPRDQFVLSTKVGRLLEPNPTYAGEKDDQLFDVPAMTRRRWDFSADGVRRSLEESLERLGLDRVDVVYLHDPDDHWRQALDEALPALVKLRDQGVVGAVGAGMNFAAPLTELVTGHDVDLVMCAGRHTLLEQAPGLLDAAAQRGVGVVVAGVYNSGLLARPRPPEDASYDYAPAPPEVLARARSMAEVCERHGLTLPEVAVAYPLRHPAVVSVVVGASRPEQVSEAVERARTSVPDALWAELHDAGLLRDTSQDEGEGR